MSDFDPTSLIHHPYQAPAGFAAPQIGVHKASTVIFPDVAAMRGRDWRYKNGYTYGLHGTPTTFTLEERIAALEGGTECVLVPSGLAAMITPATQLVWLEAAGSVTMEFPDLNGLVQAAKSRGVLTALDNTWGAGIAFRPFELGIDVVMQALTKFPSGGGDVLMGSVTTRDVALHERIKLSHMHLGLGVAANDAELLLRSLPSIAVRYAAHDATARELAAWLGTRPEVARVLHPAFDSCPGHAHWKGSCTAAAGLFSVMFDARYPSAQVDAFVDALKLFKIGYSWAGPVSLVVPYDLKAMRGDKAYPGTLVRFSIGLESAVALKADLAQALAVLG